MLSIEHTVPVKPLFQQNIQLTLNLHMLVSGNTAALLWLIMNERDLWFRVCFAVASEFCFIFSFLINRREIACSIFIDLSNVGLSRGVF